MLTAKQYSKLSVIKQYEALEENLIDHSAFMEYVNESLLKSRKMLDAALVKRLSFMQKILLTVKIFKDKENWDNFIKERKNI